MSDNEQEPSQLQGREERLDTVESPSIDETSTPTETSDNDRETVKKTDARQSLYDRLGLDSDSEDEPHQSASEETPTDVEDSSSTTDSSPETSQEQVTDESAETPTVEDEPTGHADIDALVRVPDAEWKTVPKPMQERFASLRGISKQLARDAEKVQQRSALADYGEQVIRFAEQHQIPDQELDQWLGLAPVVAKGGEEAVNTLLSIAKRLGYQEPQAAPAQPEKPPEIPPHLKKLIDDGILTDSEALGIHQQYAPAKSESPSPQVNAPQAPQRPQVDPSVQQGAQQVSERVAQATQRLGSRYAEIAKEVEAETKRRCSNAPPAAWAAIYETVLDLVEAKHKQPTARPAQSLSPQSSTTATQSQKPKSPRDALYSRLGIR